MLFLVSAYVANDGNDDDDDDDFIVSTRTHRHKEMQNAYDSLVMSKVEAVRYCKRPNAVDSISAGLIEFS